MKSASCRYFTVYGERGHENHAVIAMSARAFVGQSPFVVWGTGTQIRNRTHISDIARGRSSRIPRWEARGLIFHFLQGLWYRFLVDAKIYEARKFGAAAAEASRGYSGSKPWESIEKEST